MTHPLLAECQQAIRDGDHTLAVCTTRSYYVKRLNDSVTRGFKLTEEIKQDDLLYIELLSQVEAMPIKETMDERTL